jgi:hypothetical protein
MFISYFIGIVVNELEENSSPIVSQADTVIEHYDKIKKVENQKSR